MTASRMQSWKMIVVGDKLIKISSDFADIATKNRGGMKVLIFFWKTEVQSLGIIRPKRMGLGQENEKPLDAPSHLDWYLLTGAPGMIDSISKLDA